VFREQDGNFTLDHQPLHQRDQVVTLARRHAGGRLVHQEQARIVGERDGKLDPLHVAVGELLAGARGGVRHADLIEQLDGADVMATRERGAEPEDLLVMAHQCHLHVLRHGHRPERRGDLEGTADAAPPDIARVQAHDTAVLETDVAAIGRELAVDHIEAGRLPGAVGADQRQEFAFTDVEAHVVDRVHAAERL
jgi:hypothetical protein